MEAEMVYVAGDSPNFCRKIIPGGRLDWSNMTSDKGTGQILPKIIKRHTFTYRFKLTVKNVFDFWIFESKIKVCHPREMDVVEAEMTTWVTLPACKISIRKERDETWQVGVYWSAVRVRLGYV